jgi:hypothetical protein
LSRNSNHLTFEKKKTTETSSSMSATENTGKIQRSYIISLCLLWYMSRNFDLTPPCLVCFVPAYLYAEAPTGLVQDQPVEDSTATATGTAAADTGAAPATKSEKKNDFLDKIKHSFEKLVHPNKHKSSDADPTAEATGTAEPVNAATE